MCDNLTSTLDIPYSDVKKTIKIVLNFLDPRKLNMADEQFYNHMLKSSKYNCEIEIMDLIRLLTLYAEVNTGYYQFKII